MEKDFHQMTTYERLNCKQYLEGMSTITLDNFNLEKFETMHQMHTQVCHLLLFLMTTRDCLNSCGRVCCKSIDFPLNIKFLIVHCLPDYKRLERGKKINFV